MNASPICSMRSRDTAVCSVRSPSIARDSWWMPKAVASVSWDFSASFVSANAASSFDWKSTSASCASSSVIRFRPTRDSVYSLRTVDFWSMSEYMTGWVIDGSSPSLWPRRR